VTRRAAPRRVVAVVLCALVPLTLAAADPIGDQVACLGARGPGDPPDMVDAAGWLGEEGSTAVWQLTFVEPLEVPDPTEPPFRVDIVIRDPKVPTVTFGNYRRFNRLVRFDASGRGSRVELLFVPEGGHTIFDPPTIESDTMTIEIPGRLLLGTDLFGRVDLQRLRWTAVIRDGGRCDVLGNGRTSLRLSPQPPPSPSAPTDQPTDTEGLFEGPQATAVVIVGLLVLVAIAAVAIVLRRRR
jgi:hypothetical protein